MSVSSLDELHDLVCKCLFVFLALIVRLRHIAGDIQPCVVLIIEGRLSGRGSDECRGDTVDAILLLEVIEARTVTHRA